GGGHRAAAPGGAPLRGGDGARPGGAAGGGLGERGGAPGAGAGGGAPRHARPARGSLPPRSPGLSPPPARPRSAPAAPAFDAPDALSGAARPPDVRPLPRGAGAPGPRARSTGGRARR